MISFTSQSSGKIKHLYEGAQLGSGLLGRVVTLLDDTKRDTDLVCKVVNIESSSPNDRFFKRDRLLLTLNELKVLKKLKLLEGYSRKGNTFYIVMKKVNGETVNSYNYRFINDADIKWPIFVALRDLHHQGIAHLDAHNENFIVSKNDSGQTKVTAIDFNASQAATYINVSLDFLAFYIRQNNMTLQKLIQFYIKDMVNYALAHKYQTCQQFLIFSALGLSATYGIPALAITHLMVREFIVTLLMQQLSIEVNSKGLEYLLNIYLDRKIYNKNIVTIITHSITIIKSCLSIYLMCSFLSYQNIQNGTFIIQNFQWLKDGAWQKLFSNATPALLLNTAGMYFSITQILNTLQNNIEWYVMPQSMLKSKSDVQYHYYPQWSSQLSKATSKKQSYHSSPSPNGNDTSPKLALP